MNSALVINDNDEICDRLSQILEDMGWEVYTAEDKLATRRVCESFYPNLVVSDVEMHGGVGFEAISQARRTAGCDPYIIAVTRGACDNRIQRVAKACGADELVVGPISAEKLRVAIMNGRNTCLLSGLQ